MPLRQHLPGIWRLSSSLPRPAYLQVRRGRSLRARSPSTSASAVSPGNVISISLLAVTWFSAAGLAGAEEPGFISRLDGAMRRWDAADVAALRDAATSGEERDLAAASAAFLGGDFPAAAAAAGRCRQAGSEEVRVRGEKLEDLASSWQAVFRSLVRVDGECEGVVVRVPAGQESWGKTVVRRLPGLVQPYLEYFGLQMPVEAVFVEGTGDLAALIGAASAKLEQSGTVAATAWGRIVIVSPGGTEAGLNWERVLRHELVHRIVHLEGKGGLPPGLEEGIATWLEALGTGDGAGWGPTRYDRGVLWVAQEHGLGSGLDSPEAAFHELGGVLEVRVAFLSAALLVDVMVEKGGGDAVVRLVEAVGGGKSWQEALEDVCGMSWGALAQKARARWKGEADGEAAEAVLVTIGQEWLTEKEKGVLEEGKRAVLLGDHLWGRGKREAALQMYGRLPAALRGTPEVVWREAELLLGLGRAKEAGERVAVALRLFPEDARVLYCAGRVHLALGDRNAARRYAEEAWNANPFSRETAELMRQAAAE